METDAHWVSCIAQLVAKSNIDECLGHAAFATDVLAKTRTLDVRINDFADVPRVKPLFRPFDADEKIGIKSFDKKAPTKD